jgi:hypothetical protein
MPIPLVAVGCICMVKTGAVMGNYSLKNYDPNRETSDLILLPACLVMKPTLCPTSLLVALAFNMTLGLGVLGEPRSPTSRQHAGTAPSLEIRSVSLPLFQNKGTCAKDAARRCLAVARFSTFMAVPSS